MAKFESDIIELRNLDKLTKALKIKSPTIRIGVLGGGARKSKNGKVSTNATIGAVHEFGSPARNIPQRSFLRMPIADHLEKNLEAAGAFDQDVFAEVIRQADIMPWIEKIAIEAKGIVLDAFHTEGFGQWAPWAPGYSNEGGSILTDSQQLRDSISYEVKK